MSKNLYIHNTFEDQIDYAKSIYGSLWKINNTRIVHKYRRYKFDSTSSSSKIDFEFEYLYIPVNTELDFYAKNKVCIETTDTYLEYCNRKSFLNKRGMSKVALDYYDESDKMRAKWTFSDDNTELDKGGTSKSGRTYLGNYVFLDIVEF